MSLKLKDGMEFEYFTAHAVVQADVGKGALLIKWENPPSDSDIEEFMSFITSNSSVTVEFAGRFKTRSEAEAAHEAYLKGPA